MDSQHMSQRRVLDETLGRGQPVGRPRGRAGAAVGQPARVRLWLALCLIFLFALAVRAVNLNQSFDIFVDEANYYSLGESVATSLEIRTHEGPFYLHPPAFFFLEAAYIKALALEGNLVEKIFAVRSINILLAGLSSIVVFLIGRRLAGWPAGMVAALIFAVEPFTIRISSRNFLEPSAMLYVLLGYYALLGSAGQQSAPGRFVDGVGAWRLGWRNGLSWWSRQADPTPLAPWRVVVAGVAFGLAMLTKEVLLLLTLAPLAVCFVLNWSLPRRSIVLIGLLACAIYAIYPIMVYLTGHWGDFWWQKESGLMRFSGVRISTGFNQAGGQAGGPSFIEAILLNLTEYATTYCLLGLGGLAVGVLFLLGDGAERLFSLLGGIAYTQQTYSLLFGTNEEHFYYYVLVPGIIALVVVSAHLVRLAQIRRRTRIAAQAALAVLAGAYLGWVSYAWTVRHLTPDNGMERLVAYVEDHVPAGSRIATTAKTSDWLLHPYDYERGRWGTLDAVLDNCAEYVVISTKLVETRHDIATPELYDWLNANARPEFSFSGPSTGTLLLFRVPEETLRAANSACQS